MSKAYIIALMLLNSYTTIWFCGLAASGKTTCLKLLKAQLKNQDLVFLNDSQEIIEFITQDTNQRHHYRPTPDSFILTDSEPVRYSVNQLIAKVSQTSQPKIIELSRGIDKEGIVDFSFASFLSQLPEKVKKNSLFVYLYVPFAQRQARNNKRGKYTSQPQDAFASFYCPEPAMKRFFYKDDFFRAVEAIPVDTLLLSNTFSADHLENRVKTLFAIE